MVIPGVLLLLLVLGVGGYFGYQTWQKTFLPAPKADVNYDAPPQQVLGLVESVGRHIPNVPNNEIPTVATVSDLAKLSDQAFFQGAAKGDKVLIYTANKRAYLYRPSTDTVVKSGTIQMVGEKESTATATSSADLNATDSAVLRVRY